MSQKVKSNLKQIDKLHLKSNKSKLPQSEPSSPKAKSINSSIDKKPILVKDLSVSLKPSQSIKSKYATVVVKNTYDIFQIKR